MKVRKYSVLIVLVLVFTFVFTDNVNAWQNGYNSGPGGSSGSGTWDLTDGGNTLDSGTYLFQLVYKPKDSERQYLKCAVVYSGSDTVKSSSVPSLAYKVADKNDCEYVTSGVLQEVAWKLKSENLSEMNLISTRTDAKKYINAFENGLYDTLKEKGSEPGNYYSYGYRILIQKLTCYGTDSNWCQALYPRKQFANDYPNNLLFGGSWQGDLYTSISDIGIWASTHGSNLYTTRGRCWNYDDMCYSLGRDFADYGMGDGYNIIAFTPDAVGTRYNYSIDAACENCKNTLKGSNGTYIIQDTTNKKAIEETVNLGNDDDAKKVKSYFKRSYNGSEFLCREEYKIAFPNANTNTKVSPGRYITVGLHDDSGDIQNFGPIRAQRMLQCKSTNGGNVNDYFKSLVSDSRYDAGDVYLEYKETKKYKIDSASGHFSSKNTGKNYSLKRTKLSKLNNKNYSGNIGDIGDGWYSFTISNYYQLPDDVYMYVDKSGLAINGKEKVENGVFKLSSSTLSASFIGNATYTSSGKYKISGEQGLIKLSYNLPTYKSLLSEAFADPDGYFGKSYSDPDKNIYKNQDQDGESINDSACAKLYGVGNDKFNACKNARTGSDRTGGCRNFIYGTSDGFNTSNSYVCPINYKEDDEDIGSCKALDVDTCEITMSDGTTERVKCDNYPNECKASTCYKKNSSSCSLVTVTQDKSWPDNYFTTGEGDSIDCDAAKKLGYKQCSVDNPNGDDFERKKCVAYDNYQYCQIFKYDYSKGYSAKNKVLIDSGKCGDLKEKYSFIDNVKRDCETLNSGGYNVIYRTIDLNSPFPGITGAGRNSGANWCSYDNNGKLQCRSASYNIEHVIFENRGTKKGSSKSVYKKTALYSFELDGDRISSIRSYNKHHDYSSNDGINCDTDGLRCLSDFVHDNVSGGTCSSKSRNRFYTCAEK